MSPAEFHALREAMGLTQPDLGGGCHDYPPARRRQPLYWCHLLLDVHDLGGQPGFALRVPQDAGVARLLRLCGGVQGKARPAYRGATSTLADMEARCRWFVPAGRWRDLRKHLPAVKGIIVARAAITS